jgi:hypothetical protein
MLNKVAILALSGLDPDIQHILSVSNAADPLFGSTSAITFDTVFER